MRFTSFLIESRKNEILTEKHDLVLQKVLDAVDNGHVEYSDTKIAFDIGQMTDSPKLRGLKLVIRPGAEDSVKLGQAKDESFAIVITTKGDMPGRQDIDTFLATKPVYAGFKRAFKTYVSKYHDHDKEYDPSNTDKRVQSNSREGFEGAYNDLMTAASKHHKKYTDAIAEIDKEMGMIANVGRKKALELAKDNLRDEYIGKNAKEFISKIYGLPEADFNNHLDKQWKEKLEARLTSFYNGNYGNSGSVQK